MNVLRAHTLNQVIDDQIVRELVFAFLPLCMDILQIVKCHDLSCKMNDMSFN
jgi:hypothetical protein